MNWGWRAGFWLVMAGVGIALAATHFGYVIPVLAVAIAMYRGHQVRIRNKVIVAQREELDQRAAERDAVLGMLRGNRPGDMVVDVTDEEPRVVRAQRVR
jgi:hypothetical protein